MLPLRQKRVELPPTAGLPLVLSDWIKKPREYLGDSIQSWLDIPTPVFTCSGTAALIIALTALRQRTPDRNQIIVPAYTCPLVALAAHFVPGTEIVACDLFSQSINLDAEQLAALCNERTLAVVATHLGGRVADVATAISIARKYDIPVIEDAAQAMGAKQDGKSVGLNGDIGFFSLAAGKGLTMYEGGVLFSREQNLHELLLATAKKLLPASFPWNAKRTLELLGYTFFYHPNRLGLVYGRHLRKELARHNEIAAIGDDFTVSDIPLHSPNYYRLRVAANAIERLPDFIEQGKIRARKRIDVLSKIDTALIIDDSSDDEGVWPFVMVLMQNSSQRDAILARLWRQGLGVSKLFVHALPDYPFLSPWFRGKTVCQNARDFAARMFTITNTHWLDDESFHDIVEQVRACS